MPHATVIGMLAIGTNEEKEEARAKIVKAYMNAGCEHGKAAKSLRVSYRQWHRIVIALELKAALATIRKQRALLTPVAPTDATAMTSQLRDNT